MKTQNKQKCKYCEHHKEENIRDFIAKAYGLCDFQTETSKEIMPDKMVLVCQNLMCVVSPNDYCSNYKKLTKTKKKEA